MFLLLCSTFVIFFFFKQKTAYEMRISDWSSDVCSSDLIGDELGAVVIVDAEYLQDAGVRQEGAGAALVERAELVNVLQDRPELDAVAGHEAHSALDGFEAAEGGELIEQEQDGAGRTEERRVGKECARTCSTRWGPKHLKHTRKSAHQGPNFDNQYIIK